MYYSSTIPPSSIAWSIAIYMLLYILPPPPPIIIFMSSSIYLADPAFFCRPFARPLVLTDDFLLFFFFLHVNIASKVLNYANQLITLRN